MKSLHNAHGIPRISDVEAAEFVRSFERMACDAHVVNVRNGWWEKREKINKLLADSGIDNVPHAAIELLGLAGTEIAEAIEAVRKHDQSTWHDSETKDTLVRELAGTIVRIMDLAVALNLPLGAAIIHEVDANAERGFRHGGKAA